MERFLELFQSLDQTTSTNEKKRTLTHYFKTAPKEDAVWALFFLSGRRIKSLITSRQIGIWAEEKSNLPHWLFMESYGSVGDTAETAALLVPGPSQEFEPLSLSYWMEERILPLISQTEEEKKEKVFLYWDKLPAQGKFIFNKILTGAFRVGVSEQLVAKALAEAYNITPERVLSKLQVPFEPTSAFFDNLVSKTSSDSASLVPYPFYLASPLDRSLENLGRVEEFLVEWKWDGIRCQAVKNEAGASLWSRGGELITHSFPELSEELSRLSFSGILDGEILVYENNKPRAFGHLQKRLGRKKVSQETLKKYPVTFIAYDLLKLGTEDLRQIPLESRREKLLEILIEFDPNFFIPSLSLAANSWEEVKELRENAMSQGTEGLMIKKRNSVYGYKREKGYWWKYKVDPFSIDAVLMYAEPGSGKRSGQYTDYTFGVWEKGELVPVAKAYSGLTLKEIEELDRWIRRHTLEKFGPVRQVEPFHVFEIRFEGIQESNRHKAKLALRFPRLGLWRKDKPVSEADTLDNLRILLSNADN